MCEDTIAYKHTIYMAIVIMMMLVKAMLPESIPVLKDKAAEQFEKYDARPLKTEEVTSLKEADEFFAKHKPR